jgi:formylglycine-generating enzyme required for sulfatase activity
VQDCYDPDYDKASSTGAAGTVGDCGRHVLRGGAWDSPASHLRSAMRGRNLAGYRDNDFGFRIARDL